jgi:hypothetical protein
MTNDFHSRVISRLSFVIAHPVENRLTRTIFVG